MQLPIGSYRVDLENTARILSGAFTSRFEMQPGYEEAVREFFDALKVDPAIAAIRLDVTPQALILDNGEDRTEYPIVEQDVADGVPRLQVNWEGRVQPFTVHTVAPGSIQFSSAANQLGSYAWREAPR